MQFRTKKIAMCGIVLVFAMMFVAMLLYAIFDLSNLTAFWLLFLSTGITLHSVHHFDRLTKKRNAEIEQKTQK